MEFPRHLHQPEGRYVVATNDTEYDQLKALGWTDRPLAHVEQPVSVRLWDALRAEPVTPESVPTGGASPSVSDLSVESAKVLIASATDAELDAIEAEETAGKGRKGILALIEVRRADLIGD